MLWWIVILAGVVAAFYVAWWIGWLVGEDIVDRLYR